MIKTKIDFETSGVELKETTFEKVAKFFDKEHLKFVDTCDLVHRKSVFQGLGFLIRICPVDTGRLRGSFTPFFDRHGNTNYEKYIAEAGLASYPIQGKKKGFSRDSVVEGKNEGDFVDKFMDTTISTNVSYAAFADSKTGFSARFLLWLDQRYNKNFEHFLDKAAQAGLIPKIDPNDEGSVT